MSEFDKLAALFAKEKIQSDDGSERKAFIDTGIPHLNYILSGSPYGGLPQSRITEISGESMSGKTVLLSQLYIAAQKMGGLAAHWDHEDSYEAKLSEKNGLILTSPRWLYKKGDTFESTMTESIQYGEKVRESGFLDRNAPILVGIDSFAAMIPKQQLEKEMDETTMHDMTALPRQASTTIKVYNKRAARANVTTVFLNQLAANMDAGMYGPKTKTKGGKSLPFFADTRLSLTAKKGYDKKNLKRQFRTMTIEVVKSRTVFPGAKIEIDLNYNPETRALSFDVVGSYVDFLAEIGIWEKSGAWYSFGDQKFQGTDQIKSHYKSQSDGLEQLKKLHQAHIDRVGLAEPTSIGDEEDGTTSDTTADAEA